MTRRITQMLARFRKDEKGLAAIEFALFFPLFMGMFFWAVELGIMQIKSVMLDHALDVSIREIRLGMVEDPSPEKLKTAICSRARIIGDCADQLMIDLRPVSTTTWAMPNTPVACVNNDDEDMQPTVTFDPGRQNEIMLVRACVNIPVTFPNLMFGRQLHKDSSGRISIASITAFVNEPS
ncbi:MAG: pilus assembly protein [Rhodobacteraceae bacterium]|nr:pilus assembly protein [Paracoccaceae bacterium]